jgi:hypothetical protein
MEAQLWFSKGEKMEAWLGFSMDGVLVGCCWVTLSYKKYMGQPLTITHKPTSNHRCPLKLCCVSCPMMHSQRRAKCESLSDLLLTRERHSAFSDLHMWQNFRVYAKVFKTFFSFFECPLGCYILLQSMYNIKLCHLQTKNPIPWHLS